MILRNTFSSKLVFGKTMENTRKCRDIKLVTTGKRKSYLVLEPNYNTKKSKMLMQTLEEKLRQDLIVKL